MSAQGEVPQVVLQDYLESLADKGGLPSRRLEKILNSYAELQYRLHGGGKCAVCRTAVRHVIAVRVERENGSIADFQCLCTRCLEAEKQTSKSVSLTIGKSVLVYTSGHKRLQTRAFKAVGF